MPSSHYYIGARFAKGMHSKVFEILEKFQYPIATFVTSCEEFACMKDVGCSNCGDLVADKIKTEEEQTEFYCFVEAEKNICKEIWMQMTDLEEVKLAFYAESLNALFTKFIRILCEECKKALTAQLPEPEPEEAVPSTPSVPSIPSIELQIIKPEPLDDSDEARYEIINVFSEEKPIPAFFPVKTVEIPHNRAINYQGDFSSLCSNNPEYQWTKCKLCMRILRTKRSDASRMRTLQTSHARNHVTRFQYACKLCSFGCRFHGGIQLHMTRMHPGHELAYVDRSRDSRYKNEIADMVVTCFGQEIRIPRGVRHELAKQQQNV